MERQKGGWTGEVAEMRLEGVGLVECWRFFRTEVWEKLRGKLKIDNKLSPKLSSISIRYFREEGLMVGPVNSYI